MNLEKKRALASRALNIGKNRISFNPERLNEIKDSLTKQDIRDLVSSRAILIKEIKGRKQNEKRKTRRREGSIKQRNIDTKGEYMLLTRKLRSYLLHQRSRGLIPQELFLKVRKEIKSSSLRSLSHLKERLSNA